MEIGDKVNWFITGDCNLSCRFCFRQNSPENYENTLKIAHILAKNKVKRVTIGGGEPTIVSNLIEVLRILKSADIYVSLHTNGLGLDENKISELSGLVDCIGLPVDSHEIAIQKKLRGDKFISTYIRLPELVKVCESNGIKFGYHTVFTTLNMSHMGDIYEQIKLEPFDYWKIYEFDHLLAYSRACERLHDKDISDEDIYAIQHLADLTNAGTERRGGTDALLAHFISCEERMEQYNDSRLHFLAVSEPLRTPYLFLDNSGDLQAQLWFSSSTPRKIGNLLRESYSDMVAVTSSMVDKDLAFDDQATAEFVEALNNKPLWTRLDDGAFWTEELTRIQKRYIPEVERLSALHLKRMERQDIV